MLPTTLLDLPPEILYPILVQSAKGQRITLRAQYARLSRLCRALRDLFLPFIWTDIAIQDLRMLPTLCIALCSNPKLGEMVRNFQLDYYPLRFTSEIPLEDKFSIDQGVMPFQDDLKCILKAFTRLETLAMIMRLPEPVDWSFTLACSETLQKLSVHQFFFQPEHIAHFCSMMRLQELTLIGDFSDQAWEPDLISLPQSAARRVRAIGKIGLPSAVLRTFFQCFTAAEELTISFREDVNQVEQTGTALTSFVQKGSLHRLSMEAPCPLETRYGTGAGLLQVDFSECSYLQHLTLQSCVLWPLRASWDMRLDLYKILPPALRTLNIYFPGTVDERYGGLMPWDGAFQENINTPAFTSDDRHEQFRNQIIPSSRYTWLLNLLSHRASTNSVAKPYLPMLESVHLQEVGIVGNSFTEMYNLTTAPFFLPQDIAAKFLDRGVNVAIEAIKYQEPLEHDSDFEGYPDSYGDGEAEEEDGMENEENCETAERTTPIWKGYEANVWWAKNFGDDLPLP